MVFERISFYTAIKNFRIVTSSWFTAKVEDFVMVFVIRIHEAPNFIARIPIHVFKTSRRKPMNYDSWRYINQVKVKTIFLITLFGSGNGFSARMEQNVAWHTATVAATNLFIVQK
jgi:hypothetical protein